MKFCVGCQEKKDKNFFLDNTGCNCPDDTGTCIECMKKSYNTRSVKSKMILECWACRTRYPRPREILKNITDGEIVFKHNRIAEYLLHDEFLPLIYYVVFIIYMGIRPLVFISKSDKNHRNFIYIESIVLLTILVYKKITNKNININKDKHTVEYSTRGICNHLNLYMNNGNIETYALVINLYSIIYYTTNYITIVEIITVILLVFDKKVYEIPYSHPIITQKLNDTLYIIYYNLIDQLTIHILIRSMEYKYMFYMFFVCYNVWEYIKHSKITVNSIILSITMIFYHIYPKMNWFMGLALCNYLISEFYIRYKLIKIIYVFVGLNIKSTIKNVLLHPNLIDKLEKKEFNEKEWNTIVDYRFNRVIKLEVFPRNEPMNYGNLKNKMNNFIRNKTGLDPRTSGMIVDFVVGMIHSFGQPQDFAPHTVIEESIAQLNNSDQGIESDFDQGIESDFDRMAALVQAGIEAVIESD